MQGRRIKMLYSIVDRLHDLFTLRIRTSAGVIAVAHNTLLAAAPTHPRPRARTHSPESTNGCPSSSGTVSWYPVCRFDQSDTTCEPLARYTSLSFTDTT